MSLARRFVSLSGSSFPHPPRRGTILRSGKRRDRSRDSIISRMVTPQPMPMVPPRSQNRGSSSLDFLPRSFRRKLPSVSWGTSTTTASSRPNFFFSSSSASAVRVRVSRMRTSMTPRSMASWRMRETVGAETPSTRPISAWDIRE
ncbi:hypothetical protein SDC9_66054 [bioreactor metagenome]|uniref:Uncharacterized protein n=1 Tax=bioreactor metagenome TaxID=1076179 RepID=A0A644XV35_9ZZZZ